MKNTLRAAILPLAILTMTSHVEAKPEISDTHEAISQVAMDYFNGMANGDLDLMAKAFDMEYGDIKYMIPDENTKKTIIRHIHFSEFVNVFKNLSNMPWTGKILSVDVVDDRMAMVKFSLKTEKRDYVDYLALYKRNGNWRIVNKMTIDTRK